MGPTETSRFPLKGSFKGDIDTGPRESCIGGDLGSRILHLVGAITFFKRI